jgi:hypothetical protein
MYVKWVVRRHKNEELANIVFYDAYLVQSYKNEAGEPRQRTIAYLGNLRQIDGQFPTIERALFYIRMEDTMIRQLPPNVLTEEERRKLYAGLATVAPAPSEEEIRHSEFLNKRWHSYYWRERAMKPADMSSGFAQFMTEENLSDLDIDQESPPPSEESEDDERSMVIGRLSPKGSKSS